MRTLYWLFIVILTVAPAVAQDRQPAPWQGPGNVQKMVGELRKLMANADDHGPLSGHIEIDETSIGGKKPKIKGFTGRGAKGKTVVFGILERGGDLYTEVVPSAAGKSLIPPIVKHVPKGTRVSSDEWAPYRVL